MDPIQGLGDKVLVQVCLIVDDADKYAKRYAEVFGIPIPDVHVTDGNARPKRTYFGSPTEAKARIYHWHFGNVGFEILQPLGPESVWQDWLDEQDRASITSPFGSPAVTASLASSFSAATRLHSRASSPAVSRTVATPACTPISTRRRTSAQRSNS